MKTNIAGFEVELIRKRVKNLSVRIMPPAGEIRISAPYAMPETTIAAFLTEKRAWIEKSREKLSARAPLAPLTCSDGEIVFVEGVARRLTVIAADATAATSAAGIKSSVSAGTKAPTMASGGAAPAISAASGIMAGMTIEKATEAGKRGSDSAPEETVKRGRLRVSLYPGKIVMTVPEGTDTALRRAALDKLLKEQLAKRLAERFPVFEEMTGLHPTSVIIRDMHTRYGTCNTKTGRIAMSLTLAAKPPVCVDYVILHELSHLRYPDHGALFKAHLDRYMPHWREIKKLLNSTPENVR